MVWLAIPWLLLTLKRFVTGNKMRKEHIRSRDRHNPIIPPYPRVSSAFSFVLAHVCALR